MIKNALLCRGYSIDREANHPVVIRAELILPIDSRHSEEIADALKKIELLLGGSMGVNLVQGASRPRCQWCGVLHDETEKVCPQCGGAV
jgi:rubrerythrin